jgi:hypothetical protein
MSTIASYQTASASTVATRSPVFRHWYYFTALAAVPFVFVAIPSPNRSLQDIAQLEQLAPKIERAPTLSPASREMIDRLVARQSVLIGSSDPSQDARRKAAIERVSSAMKAKQTATVAQSGDRPAQD